MTTQRTDGAAFFRRAPGLFGILGLDGQIQAVSDDCHAELGFGPGDSIFAWLEDDDKQQIQATLAALSGDATTLHVRLRGCDGTYQTMRWALRTGEDAGTCFVVWTAISEAQREGNRLRFLIEAMPDMIGLADFTGHSVYINPGGCELLGYPLEETIGRDIVTLVPEYLRERYLSEIIPTVMQEGRWSGEVEFLTKAGEIVPMSQVVVLVPDESGKPEIMATLSREIRAQKQLEAALRQAIQELSTPIIQVWQGVLALPIVGIVDSERASQMMVALLEAISSKRCRVAVIDLTGVKTLDTATIDHLFRMVKAAQLLGSRCVLSGMSALMAQTVASLGLDMTGMRTFRSLEEALREAMQSLK